MEIKGKRIMVVGGAGFVGSHLVDQLIGEEPSEIIVYDNFVRGTCANLAGAVTHPNVNIIEGSITDIPSLRRAMEGVDGVFLLSALWLGECETSPRAAVDVNIVGNFNVIEAARDLGVQRVVYSSSASVYGNALTVPMTEEHPFNNRTVYGATKIAVEQLFRSMYELSKLPYIGYRYMNIYGPRMDYKGTYVSVIMKALDKIAAGERPIIFGDGSQSYDFIYVTDVARANILGMKSDVADEFFNIGAGTRTSINELVHLLLEFTGSPLQPEYRQPDRFYVTDRLGSTEKAERLLGFRASVALRDGLREVIQWRISQGLKIQIAENNLP